MTIYVELDFETCSACDLKKAGAWVYAEHPTTEILCLVFTSENGAEYRWLPGDEDKLAESVLDHLARNPETIFVAHNAMFEQAIWAAIMVPTFGFPPIPVERWEDTMATAAWKSLPLELGKTATALKLPAEKDMEGNRLTLGMSRPNTKTGMFPEQTPETLARIADYCAQDVKVEGKVRQRIGLLSEQSKHERGIWIYDQKINQRGVRLDMEFVRAGQLVVDRATKPLLAEFRDLTGGLSPGQIMPHGKKGEPKQPGKVVQWIRDQGVELDNMRKETIAALLDAEEEDTDATAGYESLADDESGDDVRGEQRSILPGPVQRVLQIRQMLGSASVKKLARMRTCVGEDGRARGLLQYHAASTGRWGGRLLQPQNFPRGLGLDPDHVVAAIKTGDPEFVEMMFGVPAIEAVSSSLRHALIPDPGKVFLVGDYAGIEARIVLALAGQHDKAALMASGADVYLDMAEDIYGAPKGSFNKKDHAEQRQIGKNTVLGCGFGMGWRKFRERYCPNQPEEFAQQVIDAYRNTWAPKVPELWGELNRACSKVVYHGAAEAEARGCVFQRDGDWMTIRLPSRWQKLWYREPAMRIKSDYFLREDKDSSRGELAQSWITYKGGRQKVAWLYGGLLTENTVQALARGLLAAAIDRLERNGFPVVLTVHDEIVCEVDAATADLKAFEQLMAEPTLWANELQIPIAVEAWAGDRYRK